MYRWDDKIGVGLVLILSYLREVLDRGVARFGELQQGADVIAIGFLVSSCFGYRCS